MPKLLMPKILAVLVSLLLLAGCVGTVLVGLGAAGSLGTYKWIEGTMEKDYPRPMQNTYNACLAAGKTLNLRTTRAQYGALESRIEAVLADGTPVKIQLIARPNDITTVKVRFGVLGNLDYSAYFHRQVMHNLGVPPS